MWVILLILPYFDHAKTLRYAIIQKKDEYIEASLEEFVEEIQSKLAHQKIL